MTMSADFGWAPTLDITEVPDMSWDECEPGEHSFTRGACRYCKTTERQEIQR